MAYSAITLYEGISVGFLLVTEKPVTPESLAWLDDPNRQPSWDDFHGALIVAPLDTDLVSSSLEGITTPIVSYDVYRLNIDNNQESLVPVAKVPATNYQVYDHGVPSRSNYRWIVFPVTKDGVGSPMYSNDVYVDWYGWSVTSLEKDANRDKAYIGKQTWNFDMQLGDYANTEITEVSDITVHKSLSRFPKTSVGESSYLTGSITGMIGGVSCGKYSDSMGTLNEWRQTMRSGETVLLKDGKGHVFLAVLHDGNSNIDESFEELPTSASFQWTQVGDLSEASVYSVGVGALNGTL